jgi:hypothetical protein
MRELFAVHGDRSSLIWMQSPAGDREARFLSVLEAAAKG